MLPYNIMQSAHSQNNKNANGNGSGRSSSSHPMDPASSSTCMSTSTNVQHQHDTGTAHSAISHYTSNFTTMFPLLPPNNQWPSHHNNHHFFPNFPPCPPHPSQFQASLYQKHQQQQLIPKAKGFFFPTPLEIGELGKKLFPNSPPLFPNSPLEN